jgi:hypothetical protein
MTTTRRVAMVGYVINSVFLAVSGVVYLLRPEFMPYHAEAVGQSWAEVEPAFQILILALMRVVGGAFLASALASVVIAIKPFREGQAWATWVLPATGLMVVGATLLATTSVARNTPGNPPVAKFLGAGVLVGLCFALSLLGRASKDSGP